MNWTRNKTYWALFCTLILAVACVDTNFTNEDDRFPSGDADSDSDSDADSDSDSDSDSDADGDADSDADTDSDSDTDSDTDADTDADTDSDVDVCLSPSMVCDDVCVNVTSDVNYCGNCTTVCAEPYCVEGTCSECASLSEKDCGAGCIDIQSDVNNCGDCEVICDAGLSCAGGRCIDHCLDGWRGTAEGESCLAETQSDRAACVTILDCLIAQECDNFDTCAPQNGGEGTCNEPPQMPGRAIAYEIWTLMGCP